MPEERKSLLHIFHGPVIDKMFNLFHQLQFILRMVEGTEKILEHPVSVQQIPALLISLIRDHDGAVFLEINISGFSQIIQHF